MDLFIAAVKASIAENYFCSFERKREGLVVKSFTHEVLIEIIEDLKDKKLSHLKHELIKYIELDSSKIVDVCTVSEIMANYTPDVKSVIHLIREAQTLLDILIYDLTYPSSFEEELKKYPLIQADKDKDWEDFIANESKEFLAELLHLVQSDTFHVMTRSLPVKTLGIPYGFLEIALVFYFFGKYDLEEDELLDYLGYD